MRDFIQTSIEELFATREWFLLFVLIRGARKDPVKLEKIWNDSSPGAHICKERHRIERCSAWEDAYRKMAIRYEKLQCAFMGFRCLGYAMINFRNVFDR